MKRARNRWFLALIIVGFAIFISHTNVEAVKATSLIFRTTTTTSTEASPESEEGSESDESGEVVKTNSNLTGVPQNDYRYDPNLPRELNGYNLSSYPFYETVPPPEQMDFKCDGLHDGFYASVPHKCQVYHHCLFGTRYDFLCANYTAFDQKTFICQFVSVVDCVNSAKYFSRNKDLYWEDWMERTETPEMLKLHSKAIFEKESKKHHKHHQKHHKSSKKTTQLAPITTTTIPTTKKTTPITTEAPTTSKYKRRHRKPLQRTTTPDAFEVITEPIQVQESRKTSTRRISETATEPIKNQNSRKNPSRKVYETTTEPFEYIPTTQLPKNLNRKSPQKPKQRPDAYEYVTEVVKSQKVRNNPTTEAYESITTQISNVAPKKAQKPRIIPETEVYPIETEPITKTVFVTNIEHRKSPQKPKQRPESYESVTEIVKSQKPRHSPATESYEVVTEIITTRIPKLKKRPNLDSYESSIGQVKTQKLRIIPVTEEHEIETEPIPKIIFAANPDHRNSPQKPKNRPDSYEVPIEPVKVPKTRHSPTTKAYEVVTEPITTQLPLAKSPQKSKKKIEAYETATKPIKAQKQKVFPVSEEFEVEITTQLPKIILAANKKSPESVKTYKPKIIPLTDLKEAVTEPIIVKNVQQHKKTQQLKNIPITTKNSQKSNKNELDSSESVTKTKKSRTNPEANEVTPKPINIEQIINGPIANSSIAKIHKPNTKSTTEAYEVNPKPILDTKKLSEEVEKVTPLPNFTNKARRRRPNTPSTSATPIEEKFATNEEKNKNDKKNSNEMMKESVKDENVKEDGENAHKSKGKKQRGKSNSRNDALYQAATTTTVAPPPTTTTPTTTTSAPPKSRPGSRRRPSRRRRPQYDYYDDEDDYYSSRDADEYDEEPRSGGRPYGEGRRRRKRPRPAQRRPIYDDEYEDERYDRTRTRVEDDYEDRRTYERPRNRRPYSDDDEARPSTSYDRSRNKPKVTEDKRTDSDRRPYDDDRRTYERPRKPYRDEEPAEEKRPSRDREERPSRTRDDYNRNRNERPKNEGRGNKDSSEQKDEHRSFSDDQKPKTQQIDPSGAGLVKPNGASIYSKPRLPPKIARPVPVNEKDKYKYVTETTKTTTQRPDEEYYEDYEDEPKTTTAPAKPVQSSRTREDNRYERPREDTRYDRTREDDRYERPNLDRTRTNFENDAPKRTVSSASNSRRRPEAVTEVNSSKNRNRDSIEAAEAPTRRPSVYQNRDDSRYNSRVTTKKPVPVPVPVPVAPVAPDEEYYYDFEEDKATERISVQQPQIRDRYFDEAKPKTTQRTFLSRNKENYTPPTTSTTTTTTTTTTTPAPTTTKAQSYVKVVKRPFLPSRGGSPYLPRGLQPLGGKNFNNTNKTPAPTTAQTTTTTTTTENIPSADYIYDADYEIRDYKDKDSGEIIEQYEKPPPPPPPPTIPAAVRPASPKKPIDDRIKPAPQLPVQISLTGAQKYEYERKPVVFNVNTNLRGEIIPKIPPKSLEQSEYLKPSSKEVFRPSPQISDPYKPTSRTPLYQSKIPENISIKQNLADSIENDYDVTINEALNPTLPNLTPIRSFPSPFVVQNDRDYTFSRFRNPVYSSHETGQQKSQQRFVGFSKGPQAYSQEDSSSSASEGHGISIRTPQSFYIHHPRYSSSFSAAETNHGLRPGHILAYDYA